MDKAFQGKVADKRHATPYERKRLYSYLYVICFDLLNKIYVSCKQSVLQKSIPTG